MEELLRREGKKKKVVKYSVNNSPKLEELDEYLLSDKKTKVYFSKKKPLDKVAKRLVILEKHINRIPVALEESYVIKSIRKQNVI